MYFYVVSPTAFYDLVLSVGRFFRSLDAGGWAALGTWAGVIVAAAVGIYARRAWRTSQNQLLQAEREFKNGEDQTRYESIQRVTSELIAAVYTLIPKDYSLNKNFGALTQDVFQQSMLFLMAVPNDFDRPRFSSLVRSLNASARLRNKRIRWPEQWPRAYSSFGFRMIEAYVDALVEFGKRRGDYDLLETWESELRRLVADEEFRKHDEIVKVLKEFEARIEKN